MKKVKACPECRRIYREFGRGDALIGIVNGEKHVGKVLKAKSKIPGLVRFYVHPFFPRHSDFYLHSRCAKSFGL